MNSVILSTAARFLFNLILLYSVFLLIRGHNHAGGGFAGGLVAACACGLLILAAGPEEIRKVLRWRPGTFLSTGLGCLLLSGFLGVLLRQNFLAGQWKKFELSSERVLAIGTPLLFDIGVYLAILGATLIILLAFEERS